MSRDEFIKELAELVDRFETLSEDNNAVGVELIFFDNDSYVWDGEKFTKTN